MEIRKMKAMAKQYIPMRPNSRQKTTSNSSVLVQVLAAQSLKVASLNGLGDTEKLETELEDEIRWEESRRQPSEVIGRIRLRCEEILHSKPVLLFIVALNIIDCLLVMGELTLDFHHVTNRYISQEEYLESFMQKMKPLYTPQLDDLEGDKEKDLAVFFNRLLHSFIFWNASQYSAPTLASDCSLIFANYSSLAGGNISTSSNSSSSKSNVLLSLLNFVGDERVHIGHIEEENYDAQKIAHGLHYASISILSVLVGETLLKIASVGQRFLKKKMEIFDAVVIFVSFTLDIIFVEGISNLHINNFVIILSFLLPWRVLRVLNSLIVAVMDQHRFHLKLLYKQKRKINKQFQEASEHVTILEKQVGTLKNLCKGKGAADWELNKALGQTLTPSGHGGLKALSKLVFQAAESFAPLSSSQLNGRTPTFTADTSSAPSLIVQCNGDVERGSNGHARALDEEPDGKGEALTSVSDAAAAAGETSSCAAGHAPSREESGLPTEGKRRTSDSGSPSPNLSPSRSPTRSPRLTFYLPDSEPTVAVDVETPAESEGRSVTRL